MEPNNDPEIYAKACYDLILRGWQPVGRWIFERNGKRYDLSAADLTKLDDIERKGSFLIE